MNDEEVKDDGEQTEQEETEAGDRSRDDLGDELTEDRLDSIAAEAVEVAREMLSHFPRVQAAKVECRVEDGSVFLDIEGDSTGRLIGRKGKTIEAFQHVLSKIMSHRLRKRITIHVDSEGYKKRRHEKLRKLARETADYVAATGSARALEPMSPADRRLVHIELRDRDDVITASEGSDLNRFVVVWPADEE